MAMSVGQEDEGGAMHEINVTPFVDVMLVLLIIFMVTAPMLTAGVEIDLPKEEAEPLDMSAEDQLIVGIDKDLLYSIDDVSFPREEMPVKLAAIAQANPDQAIFLYADGTVPYSYVAELLAAAKQAGFPRVGMVFDAPDKDREDDTP